MDVFPIIFVIGTIGFMVTGAVCLASLARRVRALEDKDSVKWKRRSR